MDRQTAEQITAAALIVAEGTPADQMAADIEAGIRKSFPKSVVRATYRRGLGSYAIQITFALGDKSHQANNIMDNDPALHQGFVWFPKDADESGQLPPKLTVEMHRGTSLTVEKDESSPRHLAYDSIKFGWRKKTGTPEQIVKYLTDYFAKVKQVVNKNYDRLPKSFKKEGLGLG